MRVVMSQDRKTACLYPENGKNFHLYHSEGKVEDLIIYFLMPFSSGTNVTTMAGYIRSQEDTAVIEIEMLDAA